MFLFFEVKLFDDCFVDFDEIIGDVESSVDNLVIFISEFEVKFGGVFEWVCVVY